MRTLHSTAAALLLASTALCQVTIPPHFSTYNGYTRGYNFTAAANMIITQLDLPLDAFQPGDTASYLVQINGVQTLLSTGGAGPVGASIVVNTGDVVDILGNWSPAAPGSFTAHNSYGPSAAGGGAAPYATTIVGTAHTLNRSGWQYDIGAPGFAGTYLAPTTGQLGRVFMYANPPAGLYPNFSANVQTGPSPLSVQFTDLTFSSDPGGVLAWQWDLDGDGIVDSAAQNPTFTYNNCGSFNVTLTAIDALHGPVTVTMPNYIVTDDLHASFTKQDLGGGVFQFTDTSVPTPAAWTWDFDGDNVIDSTLQNPTWTYAANCATNAITLTAYLNCRVSTATDHAFVAPASFTGVTIGGNGTSSATAVGNLFDISVTAAEGISVCGLDCTPYSFAGQYNVDVYVTDGTYVGKDLNIAAWRLVASGTGMSTAGGFSPPVLSNVALANSFYLPAGNYGVAIYLSRTPAATTNIAYTNGPQGPFVGADLTIFPNPTAAPGIARTGLFGGGLLSPRCWNGAFYYTKVTLTNTGGHGFFGAGCAGTMPVSTLVATTAPQVGQTLSVTGNNVPMNAAFGVLGLSNTSSAFGPLPLDLTFLGAPGCSARVSLDAKALLLGAGNTVTWNLGLPNLPSLLGVRAFQQMLVLDTTANSLGIVTSDANGFVIGL